MTFVGAGESLAFSGRLAAGAAVRSSGDRASAASMSFSVSSTSSASFPSALSGAVARADTRSISPESARSCAAATSSASRSAPRGAGIGRWRMPRATSVVAEMTLIAKSSTAPVLDRRRVASAATLFTSATGLTRGDRTRDVTMAPRGK
jgi:hypothetical protein